MDTASRVSTADARLRICVEGIVQGVGFRPFVYNLASTLGLGGFVLNESEGVVIEIDGLPSQIDSFVRRLREQPPPLARIDGLRVKPIPSQQQRDFTIAASRAGSRRNTLVAPDVATCEDCRREMLDRGDRRYYYPFINCTNCGPRFTIIKDVPYDREQTTMQVFAMCRACLQEYEDPLDRRFHAQPNACPRCGPQVALSVAAAGEAGGADTHGQEAAVRQAARLLAEGKILAIKGLGGYHLACGAFNDDAVGRLRRAKGRDAKPFALMAADLQTARLLCHVGEQEAHLLQSRRRPIVLLSRRSACPVAPQVAPGYDTLGIMLPYTPLHDLLFKQLQEALDADRPAVLVMTSGNHSSEPIIFQDEEARLRLAPAAQGMLAHNRDIHMRCDDSVTRIVGGEEQIFRRARGYVPEPIRVARPFPLPLLACGAHLKNTFCLGKGKQAFLSQHIGDLENLETLVSFRQTIEHFRRLFDVAPQIVAHDLHPDYLATKVAQELPAARRVGVQHHHAHIASVLAEHGMQGPVIGVAADGAGYGPDENGPAVWGSEILVADLQRYERVAHLAYVPLPGGDRAVRQPWRMAAVYLRQAYGPHDFLYLDVPFVRRLDRGKWRVLQQMIARGLNAPPTSSMGRLFDAVAALLGLRYEVDYEGQAAVELEMLAARAGLQSAYPFSISEQISDRHAGDRHLQSAGHLPTAHVRPLQMDVTPTIQSIVRDLQDNVALGVIAARFHETVAEMLAAACRGVREARDLHEVALSGGVFQNRLLLQRLLQLLAADGFKTTINRQVPPNDGGLSLGQAAVAAAQVEAGG